MQFESLWQEPRPEMTTNCLPYSHEVQFAELPEHCKQVKSHVKHWPLLFRLKGAIHSEQVDSEELRLDTLHYWHPYIQGLHVESVSR